MSAIGEQRAIFERFCKERYGGFGDGALGCLKSKTVTKAKGEKIVRVLKGEPEADQYSPKFKHWVKQRSYKLVSHAALGLTDVLCLPAKKKVCVLNINL